MRRALPAALALTGILMTLTASPAGSAVVTKPAPVLQRVFVASEAASRTLDAEALGRGVSVPLLRKRWERVAICEVGGDWSMVGPEFSGIGFSNATWYQYGGARYAPTAGDATPDQQILIGMRVTHGWIPDQAGCSPTGW